MIRQIIHIDEEKCNGCGICANACHEGAIDIIDGKAKLVRENFCDGFGDCLPGCPTGAITFEEREAPAYDEAAVKDSQRKKAEGAERPVDVRLAPTEVERRQVMTERESQMRAEMEQHAAHAGGCPGSRFMKFDHNDEQQEEQALAATVKPASRLMQWPCQIKLLPTQAPFYDGAKLLIAADCTAYAYANMHEDFMKGRITLIGCPKLDDIDYSEKLTEIIANNDIKSVTIVRMEVPCCGGLQRAAETALKNSGKFIPWQVVTISRDGRIID
ncbi:MAG: 4Fe-4S binding protein [Lachnospiraceae bacterium]|nr:4Fe-4S binding protein [Lachnospiraceae bacterium]